ncbi:MAG: glycosyltransferase [Candidatus Abyssobacteria bacterium SURF_5]|uniref:Glycosyltransferase n=1 Tax=Abyssobacteria bacterium (strain SURF_5) TaxID=2093360 RepID=A0A3A4NXC7_ABYX5|nr:MAG: glycosyltransferase [Candidatus Abyssubacteria bacterium SURF_5]
MWLLELLFFGLTLFIGWMMFGYFLFIAFKGLFQNRKEPAFPESWPMISVIVPCFNEQSQILDKLNDLRALDYPSDCLEVVFADGGSTDETLAILENALNQEEPFRVIRCPRKGKINQINFALPQLRGDLVINTDVDARLSSDALKWIVAEFEASPDIRVVGAYSHPLDTLDLEHYYWDAQNKGRFLESEVWTASIVIAQCYGFRRSLLSAFPEDVVADDIYIAYLANTLGYRTVYSRHAISRETRSPQTYAEFLQHKFRKGNAFLRESLRFLYRLPEMDTFCKLMHGTRIAQQLLLPWMLLVWALVAGSLLTLFRVDLVFFAILFLLLLLLLTNRVFASVKLPGDPRHYSFSAVLKSFLMTLLLLLMTGLSYPFFRQSSSYARLPAGMTASDKPETV